MTLLSPPDDSDTFLLACSSTSLFSDEMEGAPPQWDGESLIGSVFRCCCFFSGGLIKWEKKNKKTNWEENNSWIAGLNAAANMERKRKEGGMEGECTEENKNKQHESVNQCETNSANLPN